MSAYTSVDINIAKTKFEGRLHTRRASFQIIDGNTCTRTVAICCKVDYSSIRSSSGSCSAASEVFSTGLLSLISNPNFETKWSTIVVSPENGPSSRTKPRQHAIFFRFKVGLRENFQMCNSAQLCFSSSDIEIHTVGFTSSLRTRSQITIKNPQKLLSFDDFFLDGLSIICQTDVYAAISCG